ncbi:hypothetical protein PMAYCL1PPCAC_13751 [Pristionchus mayeri]|uniref:Dehydrogenase n=1 Tax=Pristionchus mayeri TaxID=1317129 RepID=A0AAN4ZR80_9BILA|nr:hypothetical protein PMAYCL1PPCAC_13751 [Pristionchus mayeri]
MLAPTTFFHDKVVLVTGSSDGIGRAAVVMFASAGARVTVTGRSAEKLAITKQQCIAAGAKEEQILEIGGDVTDKNFIERLVNETVGKFGRLDVLVNNAGAKTFDFSGKKGIEIPIDNFDSTMDLNVRSVILISQLAIPHLEKTKGAIVNVSSIVAFPFVIAQPYYPLSKSCLDQLTVQMAGTLIRKGIRVNSVNPGAIRTNFSHAAGMAEETAKKFYDSLDESLPSGKCGTPEDIAKIIFFLTDRTQSEIIIGQRIAADGGTVLFNQGLSAGV